MYFAGLDIGTTGCKLVLYDEQGKLIRSAYREYEVSRKSGLHEIDVLTVWESVKTVIQETADPETAAIAVTSFG